MRTRCLFIHNRFGLALMVSVCVCRELSALAVCHMFAAQKNTVGQFSLHVYPNQATQPSTSPTYSTELYRFFTTLFGYFIIVQSFLWSDDALELCLQLSVGFLQKCDLFVVLAIFGGTNLGVSSFRLFRFDFHIAQHCLHSFFVRLRQKKNKYTDQRISETLGNNSPPTLRRAPATFPCPLVPAVPSAVRTPPNCNTAFRTLPST